MATLVTTPKDLLDIFTHKEGEDWDAWLKRSQTKLEELQEQSAALPEGEIRGGIVSFGVADGSAIYLVVSAKPLKLAPVPFLDGYQVDYATIRGLRFDDVLQRINGDRKLASIFSRRSTTIA